jgi:hypothetical protein
MILVGTGDNARHDIDSEIPRTPSEINQLNRMMVRRMKETFGEDVVVVPSRGNNDIYRKPSSEVGRSGQGWLIEFGIGIGWISA